MVHAPPVMASFIIVVVPAHTVAVPYIAPASGRPVTIIIAFVLAAPQLLVTVYITFATPEVTPVTFPKASTEAIAAASVIHTPSFTVWFSAATSPTHIPAAGVIAPASGRAFTLITVVALAAPQTLLTV